MTFRKKPLYPLCFCWAIAVNAIYHDAQHPSHIVLPLVPIETK